VYQKIFDLKKAKAITRDEKTKMFSLVEKE